MLLRRPRPGLTTTERFTTTLSASSDPPDFGFEHIRRGGCADHCCLVVVVVVVVIVVVEVVLVVLVVLVLVLVLVLVPVYIVIQQSYGINTVVAQ